MYYLAYGIVTRSNEGQRIARTEANSTEGAFAYTFEKVPGTTTKYYMTFVDRDDGQKKKYIRLVDNNKVYFLTSSENATAFEAVASPAANKFYLTYIYDQVYANDALLVGAAETFQAADLANTDGANIFGYDPHYTDFAAFSNNSSHKVSVSTVNAPNQGGAWPYLEFDFAGTGFDLISVSAFDTGMFTVRVYRIYPPNGYRPPITDH